VESRSQPSQAHAYVTLGEFFRVDQLEGEARRSEWMAVLPDSTEIVVADLNGVPSSVGIAKAISIVQSRAYLERRAHQLIERFETSGGAWRLLTIDFGFESEMHGSEFLMCFAREERAAVEPTPASPYIEIGFALQKPMGQDPLFELSIRSVSGRL
jgi:hypothetical protein